MKATGSTSGNSISVSAVAMDPLNMALNTALPIDSTNLWAGILCWETPLPTMNLTSLMISLLNRNARRSLMLVFIDCQLWAGPEGEDRSTTCRRLLLLLATPLLPLLPLPLLLGLLAKCAGTLPLATLQ